MTETDGEDRKLHPEELDVTGLICPLPVLKIRKRLIAMRGGDVLKVRASDPATQIDVPHFCREAGHELVSQDERDEVYCFTIRRGGRIQA